MKLLNYGGELVDVGCIVFLFVGGVDCYMGCVWVWCIVLVVFDIDYQCIDCCFVLEGDGGIV